MHQYGVREVEKLIHLPRSTIRAFIEAGFVSPVRGPRKAWLFSFQDLIVLRTAQALATANVPPKRIARSVKALREHLPDSMPLSGLSITAVADRVVRGVGELELAVRDADQPAFGIGALAQERVRVGVARLCEQEVEADRRDDQCDRHRGEHHEEQPGPNGTRADHSIA